MNSTCRTNRLERETSPYPLRHGFNPADGSRSEDKPVLREHAR